MKTGKLKRHFLVSSHPCSDWPFFGVLLGVGGGYYMGWGLKMLAAYKSFSASAIYLRYCCAG